MTEIILDSNTRDGLLSAAEEKKKKKKKRKEEEMKKNKKKKKKKADCALPRHFAVCPAQLGRVVGDIASYDAGRTADNVFHRVCEGLRIQGVPGGKDLTSGECSLGQTITI